MNLKTLPRFVWIIPAVLLCIALAKLPYGYYTFLRIVTCGVAGFLAWAEFQQAQKLTLWAIALSAAAIIFNPVNPLHLPRSTWIYLNLSVAALLVMHMLTTHRGTANLPDERVRR
jgi:membrane protein implicated in regulation of membrane protease activity